MRADPGRLIHLHADGVSVLLQANPGTPAVVRYWGRHLGPLGPDDAAALTALDGGLGAAGLPVIPQAAGGWMGRMGLLGDRDGRDWSTVFAITEVSIGSGTAGAPREGAGGGASSSVVDVGAGIVEIAARDGEAALDLGLTVRLDRSGLLVMQAELTNRGAPFRLHELSLALPLPDQATELLDFAGRWGMERTAQRTAFVVGTHLRENRRGRTGPDAATVLHATEAGSDFAHGQTWAVHVGWSGNHRHFAEHDSTGARLIGGGELLLPGEIVLATGESYRTPRVFAAYGDGLDAVAHRFHSYLRGRPQHPSTPRPVTLNVWEAVYFDHDETRLIDLAHRAADLGVERFVLDDGWFGARRNDRAGLGDWRVSPAVWPNGLTPLIDAVHSRGMQFGLWFEPEMVNPDSDLARAHPEWIMAARSDLPIEQRHQHVLNLSIPACFQAISEQVLAVLAEYPIDYVKWDHNRDHVEAGRRDRGGAPGEHAQTVALYRLLDLVRERHPALEIESCSAGGGRIDLGILDRTDRVWVSDCSDPLERQRLLRWTGQLLPPELMGSHVASPRSHTTGRTHDLSFRAATALFGHFGVEWDIASASRQEISELASWIEIYRQHRDLICNGAVYRGPDPDPALYLHGVVAADGSGALFEIAAIAWPEPSTAPRARLRGLDPTARYRVRPVTVGEPPISGEPPAWFTEHPVVTGTVLESLGLAVPALWPEHSMVIHLLREG